MFTGIVPDPFHMSLRTGLDMPTEYRSATGQERVDGPTHIGREPVALHICFIPLLQNGLSADLVHCQSSIIPSALRLPSPADAG
jgi:hypothetical protein